MTDRFTAAIRARWRRIHENEAAGRWNGHEDRRDTLIRRRRSEGATLQAIGLEFGLSRQRVHQILNAAA